MPIPEIIRQADADGLRQILALEAKKTRRRGFVGSPADRVGSGEQLVQDIRNRLQRGQTWLKTLDPNLATEVAYPAVQPVVARMTEIGGWAILKLVLLNMSLNRGGEDGSLTAFDYPGKECDDVAATHKPRKDLERKTTKRLTTSAANLDQLTTPQLDSAELLRAVGAKLEAQSLVTTFEEARNQLSLLSQEVLPDRSMARRAAQYLNRLLRVVNSAEDRPQKLKAKQQLVELLNALKHAFRLETVLTEGTDKIPVGTKVSLSVLVQPHKYPEGRYVFSVTRPDPIKKQQPSMGRSDRLPIRFQL